MLTFKSNGKTGTKVIWVPSEKFFNHAEIDFKKTKEFLHILSCLCVGLTIEFTVDGETETYKSKNGLNDLVDDEVKDTELISTRLNLNYDGGRNKIDMVPPYLNL